MRAAPLLALVLVLTALGSPAAAAPAVASVAPLEVTDTATSLTVHNGTVGVRITKAPWRLSLLRSDKSVAVREQDLLPDMPQNPTYAQFASGDGRGHDIAYPGLPTVSTRLLAYLRGGSWRSVTSVSPVRVSGSTVTLDVATSDGAGGRVTLVLRGRAVDLDFRPVQADAVAESFAPGATERFFSGGQRFRSPELSGSSVPL